MATTRAILVDITKCIGCRSCEQACKQIHGFPKDTEGKLSHSADGRGRARRSLRATDVHALSGSGLRFGVPGRCAQEAAFRSGHL
jgi:Fe-S-cluster-containing dehydrogenase component